MASSASITVDRLYELAEVLDNSKDKIAEHESVFTEILSGRKGGSGEKKLTSSFIVRYFHHFPNLRDPALDALFELCEDDDVTIRKVVIKELPHLCKDAGPHVSKVADVLTQLLQAEDTQEHMLVTNALMGILKKFPKETLATIFGHILNAEEELIRDRAVKFMAVKVRLLPAMSADLENFIIEESKKVLQDVTGEEFVLFIHILSSLSQLQTVSGRQKLLGMITEQADLDKSFDPKDSDRVDQICQCIKQAIPYLSKNVPSTNFVEFLLVNVVPSLDELSVEGSETVRLEILRTLADLAPHCGELKDSDEKLNPLFERLLDCLPLPPSETGEAGTGENTDAEKELEEKVKFSETECLLWAMHQLGKKHPSFFSKTERADQMKELTKRLQYTARMIQVYSKKLREHLQKKTKEEIAKEEVKVIALRTTANITTLIRDLLHQPPSSKSSITPSWKPPPENKSSGVANGTHKTDDDEPARKTSRKEGLSMYRPPSGKFSEKAGTFQESDAGYGGMRRGGDWRGRGGWRGNWGRRGYRY